MFILDFYLYINLIYKPRLKRFLIRIKGLFVVNDVFYHFSGNACNHGSRRDIFYNYAARRHNGTIANSNSRHDATMSTNPYVVTYRDRLGIPCLMAVVRFQIMSCRVDSTLGPIRQFQKLAILMIMPASIFQANFPWFSVSSELKTREKSPHPRLPPAKRPTLRHLPIHNV